MADDRHGAPARPDLLVPLSVLGGVAGFGWFLGNLYPGNLPGAWAPPLVGWLLTTAAALASGAVTWRASRTGGLLPQSRRFWRHMAIAVFAVAAGVLFNARDALTGPVVPNQNIGGAALGLYTLGVVTLLWAVLRLPGTSTLPAAERRRFWLDLAVLLTTTFLFVWYLPLHDGPRASAVYDSRVALLTVVGMACVAVLAFAKVALVGPGTIDPAALRLLSVSAAIGAAGGGLAPLLASRPHLASCMLTVPLCGTLVALAAESHRRSAGRPPRPPRSRKRPFSLIPYAAVVATDALLITAAIRDGGRTAVVAVGAVALTGVVIYRQIRVLYENARLLRRVDSGMQELQDAQRQLAHQAQHDDLTGLVNRRLFEDRTRRALRDGEAACVVLIDLDDFKGVNDRLGHVLGDGMLVVVGRRLSACVRPDDTVARLGGDEFALLLRGMSATDAAGVIERVGAALERPISVGGHDLLVQSSIGVAGAAPGVDPTELLRRADLAMYAAKARGKGRHAWYEPELDRQAANDAQLGADLRQALDRGEFFLVFQPVVRLPDGRPAGAEALVRWKHPERGLIRPDLFIAAAERTGLIAPLGDWILNEACRQAGAWLREYGATQPWKVSVNISARQLREPGIAGDVAAALRAADLPAERLMVEVTETAVFDNGPAVEALNEISALGVAVALDDFGTGHSSLGLLRTTPVDVLKVDKSFVDGITGSTEEAVIATAMIQITEGLHLGAVAEGVETLAQAQRLYQLGYRLAQGYYFARPLPAEQVGVMLAEEARRTVPAA